MFCAIWYYLHNLKNVKSTHGGVLALLHGCFPRFLNCTNGTKSRNAPQIVQPNSDLKDPYSGLKFSAVFWSLPKKPVNLLGFSIFLVLATTLFHWKTLGPESQF